MDVDPDHAFKQFLHDTRVEADRILDETHHDIRAVKLIQSLLQIVDGFENKTTSQAGQSGDMRMLRREIEQLKMKSGDSKLKEFKRSGVVEVTDAITIIVNEGIALAGSQMDSEEKAKRLKKLRNSANLIAEHMQVLSL